MNDKSLIEIGVEQKYIEISEDGKKITYVVQNKTCLLYTSDAADE